MHLHQHNLCIQIFQDLVDLQEGIIGAVVHIAPADQIDHRHRACLAVENTPTLTGQLGSQIGRPQDLGAILQIVHDLPLGEGVVAHGDHIGTGIQNILTLAGGHAYHRGIFTVYDDKIRTHIPLQFPQAAADPVKTRIAHHITYR